MSFCPNCASSVDETWRFCRSCGNAVATDLLTATEDPVWEPPAAVPASPEVRDAELIDAQLAAVSFDEGVTAPLSTAHAADVGEADITPTPTPTPVSTSRVRRWAKPAALSLAVILLVSGALFIHLGTRDDLSRTKKELASTQTDLSETKASLADSEDKVADLTKDLAAKQSELTAKLAELESARGTIAAKDQELAGVRGSLSNVERRVELQAGQIETLKSCLNGVTLALIHAANFDYRSAVAALEAVEVSCQRANELV